jgi:hypothetical protein
MPRACSFLCVLGDRQLLLFHFHSLPIELLSRSRKKHIAATVKRRFYRILDDTDVESFSL